MKHPPTHLQLPQQLILVNVGRRTQRLAHRVCDLPHLVRVLVDLWAGCGGVRHEVSVSMGAEGLAVQRRPPV